MSALGQKQTSQDARMTAALPLKADKVSARPAKSIFAHDPWAPLLFDD